MSVVVNFSDFGLLCDDDNMELKRIKRMRGGPVVEETARIGAGLDEAIRSSFTILSQIGSRIIATDFCQI